MSNIPLIDHRQIKPFTNEVIQERFDDGSIPISKIEGLEEFETLLSDLRKNDNQLVIPVTTEDEYKHIMYDKNLKPQVLVIDEYGRQVECSIEYLNESLLDISWNNRFNGNIYIR